MKKTKKYIKILNSALLLLMAASLVLTFLMLFFRLFGSKLEFGGVSLYRIVTGSMEPKYLVGDYVILKKTAAEHLNVDDIIAFVSDSADTSGETLIHRISAFETDGKISTKGDANPVEDYKKIESAQIVGRVTAKITILRQADKFFSRVEIFALLVVLPLLLIMASEIYGFLIANAQKREILDTVKLFGLDTEDEQLIKIAERFGIDALKQISQGGCNGENNCENCERGGAGDEE